MFITSGLGAVLVGALALEGDTLCPSVDAVRDALSRLEAQDSAATAGSTVELSETPSGLVVTLRSGGGDVEAQRIVEVATGDCAQAAQDVALLVALWTAQLDSGTHLDLPDRPALPPAPTPYVQAKAKAVRDKPVRPAWVADTLIGALASRSGPSVAPALTASLRLRKSGSNLGLVSSVLYVDEHAQSLDVRPEAAAYWRQVGIGIGPSLTLPFANLELLADVQLHAGLAFVWGDGLDRDASGRSVEFGGRAALAVSLGKKPLGLWLGGCVSVRARQQRVLIGGDPDADRLPNVEVLFGGGFTFQGVM